MFDRNSSIAMGLLGSDETPAFWRVQAAKFKAAGNVGDAYHCGRRARDLEDLYGFTCWN